MSSQTVNIRAAYVARPGYYLLDFDYSQIEFRFSAALAGEKQLVKGFEEGNDYYTMIYDAMFATTYKVKANIPKLQRKVGKEISLGQNYGQEANGLARKMKVPYDQAKDLMDKYWGGLPYTRAAREAALNYALQHGKVRTWFGRIRPLPDLYSNIRSIKAKAVRSVWNCLDSETEALTRRGWVKGFDLQLSDILLTKNIDSGKLEWQPLRDLKLFPDFEGELVDFKTKHFSATSTPNHRWMVTDAKSGKVVCRETEKVSKYGDHRIHRTGEYSGQKTKIYSDDFVELCGWYLTDGSGRELKSRFDKLTLYQSQRVEHKAENVRRIDNLIARMGLEVKRDIDERSDGVVWQIWDAATERLLGLLPGRVLNMDFVCSLTRDQAQLLIDVMLLGDGVVSDVEQKTFLTGNEESASLFQVLATFAGIATNSSYRDMSMYEPVSPWLRSSPKMTGIWSVSLLKRKVSKLSSPEHVRRYKTKQPIWCPVVDNTYFVARKDKCVFITGNTIVQGSCADWLKMAMIRTANALEGRDAHILLTVQDELVIEVSEKEPFWEIRKIVKEAMEFKVKGLPVGMTDQYPDGWFVPVSEGYGYDWGHILDTAEEFLAQYGDRINQSAVREDLQYSFIAPPSPFVVPVIPERVRNVVGKDEKTHKPKAQLEISGMHPLDEICEMVRRQKGEPPLFAAPQPIPVYDLSQPNGAPVETVQVVSECDHTNAQIPHICDATGRWRCGVCGTHVDGPGSARPVERPPVDLQPVNEVLATAPLPPPAYVVSVPTFAGEMPPRVDIPVIPKKEVPVSETPENDFINPHVLITVKMDITAKETTLLGKVLEKFPGQHWVYLDYKGKVLKLAQKFCCKPDLQFQGYIKKVFGESTTIETYDLTGKQERPTVAFA